MVAHAAMTCCKTASNDDTQGHFVPLVCSANAAHVIRSFFSQVLAVKAVAFISVAGSNPATR
jgi:hypothetical protein